MYQQTSIASVMKVLAINCLGPRLIATFANGLAFDAFPGMRLSFGLATDVSKYAVIAAKIGEMHRRLR